jgi:hypothetical protein
MLALLHDAARACQRAPRALFPLGAAAHRADGKRAEHGHAVATFGAMKLAFHVGSGRKEVHEIPSGLPPGGYDITHADPFPKMLLVTFCRQCAHTLQRANK